MTDKQFAGYVWARTGGGPSTIPTSLLLAHCSAAVRPRADIKAKAYNLMLEMYGQEAAQDLIALFEDREGARALMKATLGDPEDVTLQRLPLIIETVKLAAGEFAASRAREEAQSALAAANKQNLEKISQIQDAADLEAQHARLEKEKIAQVMFEKDQHASALEKETQNLRADLERNKVDSLAKRDLILKKGFSTARLAYWACCWLIVLLFALSTWAISANVFEFSTVVTSVLTAILSAAGYWFVPNFLEPLTRAFADRTFEFSVGQIDANIDCSMVKKDYRGNAWSIEP